MGKGSGRRPTEISEAEFQNNFDRIFRGPQVDTPPACPAIHTTEGGSRVRCQTRGEHIVHQAFFDGQDIIWLDDEQHASFAIREDVTQQ